MMDLDSRVFTIYSIPFLSSSFSSSGTQPILTPILKWTLKEWKLLVQVGLSNLMKVNGQYDHWKWTIPDLDVFVCTRCWAYLQTSVIINKNDCGRLKFTLTNSGNLSDKRFFMKVYLSIQVICSVLFGSFKSGHVTRQSRSELYEYVRNVI